MSNPPTKAEIKMMGDAEIYRMNMSVHKVCIVKGECVGLLTNPDMGMMWEYSDEGCLLVATTAYPSLKKIPRDNIKIIDGNTSLARFGKKGYTLETDGALKMYMGFTNG